MCRESPTICAALLLSSFLLAFKRPNRPLQTNLAKSAKSAESAESVE